MKTTSRTDGIATTALAVVCAAAMLWLLTHDGCAHPLGNALALIAYAASGLALLLPRAAGAWHTAGHAAEGDGERRPRMVAGRAGRVRDVNQFGRSF